MPYAEYTVRLEAFEGPLDLLLFLIRRAEVEITDIPIATITDQYLRHIANLTESAGESGGTGTLDIERAGEFLVMAATLMEIKSRLLAPPSATGEPGGSGAPGAGEGPGLPGRNYKVVDPRAELVQQLLDYKRYRDASDRLEHFRHEWHARFPSGRALPAKAEEAAQPEPEQAGPVEIEDLTLVDLVEAFARITESVDFSRLGEHRVVMDDTPVELHAEDIIDRLRRVAAGGSGSGVEGGEPAPAEIEFVEIFRGRSRADAIGLFLAILELVKQQRIAVRQELGDASGKRIILALAEEVSGTPAGDAAGAPDTERAG